MELLPADIIHYLLRYLPTQWRAVLKLTCRRLFATIPNQQGVRGICINNNMFDWARAYLPSNSTYYLARDIIVNDDIDLIMYAYDYIHQYIRVRDIKSIHTLEFLLSAGFNISYYNVIADDNVMCFEYLLCNGLCSQLNDQIYTIIIVNDSVGCLEYAIKNQIRLFQVNSLIKSASIASPKCALYLLRCGHPYNIDTINNIVNLTKIAPIDDILTLHSDGYISINMLLLVGVRSNKIEIVKYCIDNGARLSQEYNIIAIKLNYANMIRYLFDIGCPALPNAVMTGIISSCGVDVIETLIDTGNTYYTYMCEYIAPTSKNIPLIKYMIRLTGYNDNKIYIRAIIDDTIDVVKVYHDMGIVIDSKIILCAISKRRFEIFKYCVQHCTNIDLYVYRSAAKLDKKYIDYMMLYKNAN